MHPAVVQESCRLEAHINVTTWHSPMRQIDGAMSVPAQVVVRPDLHGRGRAVYETLLNRVGIAARVLDQARAAGWERGVAKPQSLYT